MGVHLLGCVGAGLGALVHQALGSEQHLHACADGGEGHSLWPVSGRIGERQGKAPPSIWGCSVGRQGQHVTRSGCKPPHHTSRYVTSHHITSHHITSHHITSHHITSHHITSHHITSHHITSHHITSHHITSHHITSHHMTSHHIALSHAHSCKPHILYISKPCPMSALSRHSVPDNAKQGCRPGQLVEAKVIVLISFAQDAPQTTEDLSMFHLL